MAIDQPTRVGVGQEPRRIKHEVPLNVRALRDCLDSCVEEEKLHRLKQTQEIFENTGNEGPLTLFLANEVADLLRVLIERERSKRDEYSSLSGSPTDPKRHALHAILAIEELAKLK